MPCGNCIAAVSTHSARNGRIAGDFSAVPGAPYIAGRDSCRGMRMRKAAFALALCAGSLPMTAFAAERGGPDKVSFYFAAHQDDWQLFMNPSAFQDVANP